MKKPIGWCWFFIGNPTGVLIPCTRTTPKKDIRLLDECLERFEFEHVACPIYAPRPSTAGKKGRK